MITISRKAEDRHRSLMGGHSLSHFPLSLGKETTAPSFELDKRVVAIQQHAQEPEEWGGSQSWTVGCLKLIFSNCEQWIDLNWSELICSPPQLRPVRLRNRRRSTRHRSRTRSWARGWRGTSPWREWGTWRASPGWPRRPSWQQTQTTRRPAVPCSKGWRTSRRWSQSSCSTRMWRH